MIITFLISIESMIIKLFFFINYPVKKLLKRRPLQQSLYIIYSCPLSRFVCNSVSVWNSSFQVSILNSQRRLLSQLLVMSCCRHHIAASQFSSLLLLLHCRGGCWLGSTGCWEVWRHYCSHRRVHQSRGHGRGSHSPCIHALPRDIACWHEGSWR